MPARFSLGTNSFVLLATRKTTARIPANDPQSEVQFAVHEDLPAGLPAIPVTRLSPLSWHQ
jgi:hypothetical protein